MTETVATQPYTGNLYWKAIDKEKGVFEAMDLRILAKVPFSNYDLEGSGWLQTRTHQHWYGEAGSKRPFTYECPKGNHQPNHPLGQVECAQCIKDNKHFGAKTSEEINKPTSQRFWVWAIDLKDGNKLKAVDFPFSVYSQIVELVKDPEAMTYAEGGKIWTVPLRVERAGVRLATTYTVKPLRPEPFDLGETLKAQGFDKAPQLMQEYAPKTYPKIVKLNEAQLKNLHENGLLPWQREAGPGHEEMVAAEPATSAAAILDQAHQGASQVELNVLPTFEEPVQGALDINAPHEDIYEATPTVAPEEEEISYF